MARAAECTPPLDVVETPRGLEILIDLPGVAVSSIEVAFSNNSLIVAGEKLPSACEHLDAGFHMAERAFGRFVRTIDVEGAFDAGRAEATLSQGELRVVLPRLDERRGARVRIPIR